MLAAAEPVIRANAPDAETAALWLKLVAGDRRQLELLASRGLAVQVDAEKRKRYGIT